MTVPVVVVPGKWIVTVGVCRGGRGGDGTRFVDKTLSTTVGARIAPRSSITIPYVQMMVAGD